MALMSDLTLRASVSYHSEEQWLELVLAVEYLNENLYLYMVGLYKTDFGNYLFLLINHSAPNNKKLIVSYYK